MINKSLNSLPAEQEVMAINTFSSKITTNSFEGSKLGDCIGWGGLVSNLNCPKEFKYCNCHPKTTALQPEDPEPTDKELYDALLATKECTLISTVFEKDEKFFKFFGYDYSNPYSSYNCSCEEHIKDSSRYYSGITGLGSGSTVAYDNAGYFAYARRKVYNKENEDDTNYYAFPDLKGNFKTWKVAQKCEDKTIIGEYFPAYLEYSKTNATFWNTPPETPLRRQSQANLLQYQRIKILVNGSWEIKVGDMINIQYPTGEHPVIKESRFSGRWMIYKIKRTITSQNHSMYLFLMRDGLGASPNISYGNIEYNKQV